MMVCQFLMIYIVKSLLIHLVNRKKDDLIEKKHMDIACSMQKHFEDIILNILINYIRITILTNCVFPEVVRLIQN